jgi:hypothetical protein
MKRTILWLALLALVLVLLSACYVTPLGTFYSPVWEEWGIVDLGGISWLWGGW